MVVPPLQHDQMGWFKGTPRRLFMQIGQISDSYSSSIGNNCLHLSLKVKFCHKIFEDKEVERRCNEILIEVGEKYGIKIYETGFDRDHVHMDVDGGPNYAPKDLAKLFKGTTGRKLLTEFPYLKEKYFWGSGLWSPAYYFDSIGNRTKEEIDEYIRNQGKKRPKLVKGQQVLEKFISN